MSSKQNVIISLHFYLFFTFLLCYVAGDDEQHSQNIKVPNHSSKVTVTRGKSQAITTSTVRPWPSHNFFKTVLSKSDNVAGLGSVNKKGESRPTVTLNSPEPGVKGRKADSFVNDLELKNENGSQQQVRISKGGMKNETEQTLESPLSSGFFTDKARSAPDLASNNKPHSESNKVDWNTNYGGKLAVEEKENGETSQVLAFSGEKPKLDDFTHISSNIGFQYEIVFPLPSRSPPPMSSNPSSSAPPHFRPTLEPTTVKVYSASGNNNNPTSMTIQTVSDAYTSTYPLSLFHVEKATRAPATPTYSSFYISNENPFHFPTPTHRTQLNRGVVSQMPSVYPGKSGVETGFRINHSFGKVKRILTTPNLKGSSSTTNSFNANETDHIWKSPPTLFSHDYSRGNQKHLRREHNRTSLIKRKNMFTVIKADVKSPSLHVQSFNITHQGVYDRINQIERPSLVISTIQKEPDEVGDKDNDYFDDSLTNQHSLEEEQGHVTYGSTELPRFTNLTWPYYITGNESTSIIAGQSRDELSNNVTKGSSAPSTALAVSFTSSKGKEKVGSTFSDYEFYIPSAAADPLQNPILLKKPNNRTSWDQHWAQVPTIGPIRVTHSHSRPLNFDWGLKAGGDDQKGKVKQSHWGSKGVNRKPQKNKQEQGIKVYENSTGNPKATPSTFLQNFPISSTTFGTKDESHFSTSVIPPIPTWPKLGSGYTEMATFATAKTPTNIWYKPIINHFTGVPLNGTTVFYESKKNPNYGSNIPFLPQTFPLTTPIPPEYVGEEFNKNDSFYPNLADNTSPILFKLWNFANGQLTLQSQRLLPQFPFQGYNMPVSGTILNLRQIPPALHSLVTTTINRETEASRNNPYYWQKLPILLSSPDALSSPPQPPKQLQHDSSQHEKESFKQPISINYVLWHSPSPMYSQSIILSTPTAPTPQFLLSPQPTPVAYFPSRPITKKKHQTTTTTTEATTMAESFESFITTIPPSTTPSTIKPNLVTTISAQELELMFQNYFQYYITSTTPAPTTTTKAPPKVTLRPYPLEETYYSTPSIKADTKAWDDLKRLILRLASSSTNNRIGDKTSTQDQDEYLDQLGNVAEIAVIMSYLKNQQDQSKTTTTTTTVFPPITALPPITETILPYGVTDDMTPPHQDLLWASTYPLFQHFLNNPNFTFIPPPKQLSNQEVLSPTPIPFTEPPFDEDMEEEATSGAGKNDYYTRYNHYVSYYPTKVPKRMKYQKFSHIYITESPPHGATTHKSYKLEGKLGELDEPDQATTQLSPETAIIHVQRPNRLRIFKKKKKGKKDKLLAGLIGATLLTKAARPLFQIMKRPSKYWLDMKFDLDFYDLLKKKVGFLLAWRYMPVGMVLAFSLVPVWMSFIPMFYHMWLAKWLKKTFKPTPIKMPIPILKPFSMVFPFFRPKTKKGWGWEKDYSPPAGEYGNGVREYDNEHYNQNDVIHIDGQHQPPNGYEGDYHHYAGEQTGRDGVAGDEYDNYMKGDDYHNGIVNSFNYNGDYDPNVGTHSDFYGGHPSPNGEKDQEIHVHIHDEDPNIKYESFTSKDLGYGIGHVIGNLASEQDKLLLKLLHERKRKKINKLMEIWKIAKHGAGVVKETAENVADGLVEAASSVIPKIESLGRATQGENYLRRKRRRRRRKWRREQNSTLTNGTVND